MAIKSFDKILMQGLRTGQIPGHTQQARDWFRNTAKGVRDVGEGKILRSREAITTQMEIGMMYFFMYDPKHKDTLPYYDRFPLVFPIESYSDGFLGINLHYLPYILRAKLMDLLYNYVSNPNLNDKARLKISYQILKGASSHKYIQPCLKRYLTSHLRSKFIAVMPVEWDIALFLPVQNFEKASTTKVWADSRKAVGK